MALSTTRAISCVTWRCSAPLLPSRDNFAEEQAKQRSSSNGSSSDDGRQRGRVSCQLDLNGHPHQSRSLTRSQQLITLLPFECRSARRAASGVVTAAMRVGLKSPVAIGDDLTVGRTALCCSVSCCLTDRVLAWVSAAVSRSWLQADDEMIVA